MKIGIGIPCHERDIEIVRRCLSSIRDLDPQPDSVYTCINDGSAGMGAVRQEIFDTLFYEDDCDVVLACSADFGLMRGILNHVDPNFVTSFGFLRRHPADLIHIIKRLLTRRAWSGCYSITWPMWEWFKTDRPDWDGMDSSIDMWCKTRGYHVKRVKRPQYWILRFSERMNEAAVALPTLRQRITRLASAW